MKGAAMVKAWEDTITIPTYELGPEDPYPPLLVGRRGLIHPGSGIVYPYPLQEDLRNRRADKTWKIFCVENRYLRLGVLPELGGRLLYAFDKSANTEALYRNHVLKYARIGARGAFVSGGIEWNFPNGHTVTTSSAIDCAIRENADGSATILFGDVERVSRMRWSVALTLYPDRAFFETEIRLTNRTFLPHRHWFWANSAAPVSPGMEYQTTATRVSDLFSILKFPIHEGVDISWDRNHRSPRDMFSLNHRDDFGSWYNHDLERGMVNYADRTESRGLKFFTWGSGDDGGIWQPRLTDEDGPYSEMQSGRFATQRIWEILPPYTEGSWKEVWYPITGIGVPCCATREAAVSLQRAKDSASLRLGVHSNAERAGARITLTAGARKIWEKSADLSPSAPLIETFPLASAYRSEDLVLEVREAGGGLLLHHVLPSRPLPEVPVKGPVHIEPPRDARSPEECRRAGLDFEKLGEIDQARRLYEESLRRDPGYGPAAVSLGVVEFRQDLFEQAMVRFRGVLERNPADEEARFYLGSCLLAGERFTEAAEELECLMRSRTFRPGSSYLLGGICLGQGRFTRAELQLAKCVAENPWNNDASAFLACALRKQGRYPEAEARVEEIARVDPLHWTSLAERYFLARDRGGGPAQAAAKAALARALRDEPQSYLELACEYALFGLYGEAFDVLAMHADGPGARAPDPIVHYHLGYYAEKLGQSGAALHYRRGAAADPRCVFPHRHETERILRRAIEVDPGDSRARHFLGTLLCAKSRPDEAIRSWEGALAGESASSVLHRNLGRTFWKVLRDADRAIPEYQEAIQRAPDDYKPYLELERILSACGLTGQRKKLIESIPATLRDNDLIVERIAAFHADEYDFDRALELLAKTYFYPWEVYKGVRILYVDANIGKGIQHQKRGEAKAAVECYREAMQYPRNIGVGEPFSKLNAEALYRTGCALRDAGDAAGAKASWEQAAEEPRPVPDALCYYRGKALGVLGRTKEARDAFDALADFAKTCLRDGTGEAAENRYLEGLAAKGNGDAVKALRSFREAVLLKPAHRRCRWELEGFAGD